MIYQFYIFLVSIFVFICLPVNAQQKKDSPREGEGIHAFLKRNKCQGQDNYQEFLELNQGKLGKNNTLKKGVKYSLPSKPVIKKTAGLSSSDRKIGSKHRQPLFGSKHIEYTIKSNRLKGASFFLCSGHGGPDPGAVSKIDGREVHEDEYAYDITLRLARALMEEGATVYMIIQDAKDGIRDDLYLANSKRETCMGSKIPLNQLARLKQRTDKVNSLNKSSKDKYKRAMFIHVDSRSKNKRLDVFFYHSAASQAGRKLTNTMRQTFHDHYTKHQPERGFTGTVSSRNLYVLNNTVPVAIFAELGNIQNTFDQRRFILPDNRQALANWICKGFIQDYEESKKK